MEGEASEPMPRWVKVFVVVGAALLVVGIVLAVFGDGEHGAGRHAPAAGPHDHHPGELPTPPPGDRAVPPIWDVEGRVGWS